MIPVFKLIIMCPVGYAFELVVQLGQRFEVLDETVRIIIKDTSLVKEVVRVKDGLQLLHDIIGLFAPLIFHKWSHVPACSMLGLERAIVLFNHKPCHIAHHFLILLNIGFALEALVQDEMIVPFECMSVNAGIIIAMIGNKFLELDRCFGQIFNMEGNIFDKATCAYRAHATHTWEDA